MDVVRTCKVTKSRRIVSESWFRDIVRRGEMDVEAAIDMLLHGDQVETGMASYRKRRPTDRRLHRFMA